MARPRWDGDTRGSGDGNGTAFTADLRRLLDEMGTEGWLTEQPLDHLMPGLGQWLAAHAAPWRLVDAAADASVLRVHVEWTRPGGHLRDLRADAFALLGSVVEGSTHVEQRVEGDAVIFDVVTGQHGGEMRAHGHVVSLRVTGPAAAEAARGTRSATASE